MVDSTAFVLVVVLGSILLSMTLHEAMHAFTGYWLGDDTAKLEGRLSLNPIRHIDPFLTILLPILLVIAGGPVFGAAKPVPFNPFRVRGGEFGAALVGIAGPLTNLAFAVAAAGIINIGSLSTGQGFGEVLWIFAQVNVGFFVFNMIPFPPLDGSRLLYAFAPEPLQKVMQQIESLGFMGIAIFIFLLFPFISPVVGDLMEGILNLLLW